MTDIERRLRDLGEQVRDEQGSDYPPPSLRGRVRARRFSTLAVGSVAVMSLVAAAAFAGGWVNRNPVPPAAGGPYSADVPAEVWVMGEEDFTDAPALNLAWGRNSNTAQTLACVAGLPPETSRVELLHEETGDVLSWGDNFVSGDGFATVCAHKLDAEVLVGIANNPSAHRLVIDDELEVQLTRTVAIPTSERTSPGCGPPVDFEPTFVPEGWIKDLQPGSGGGAAWDVIGHYGNDAAPSSTEKADDGFAELFASESPYPLRGGERIRVLDEPARFGPIHEGFAVEFSQHGCNYALIGYVDGEELKRFAQGLRLPGTYVPAEPSDEEENFGAVWPADTYETALDACAKDSNEGFLADPASAALEFGHDVLGWKDASVLAVRGTRVDMARPSDPGGSAGPSVILTVDALVQDCYLVLGVQRSPEEAARYEEQDGASLSVQGQDVSMYFADFEDAVTATLEVGYGGEINQHQWSKGDGIAEFRIDQVDDPNDKGHYLILLRDANGDVFSAFGSPLPAGNMAAG